eukprot:CAMPEP_0114492680 /NCGR_PEP_ID=MMETSP0109-20121206/3689_1 /TAXON_ID=29199 /ORGANISM="Chlorarachnion reptans, Strain CCCM449" /LENGTH=304 /DNA_ID=CAMNT_0001669549 /DNA_START=300 /DNA_END=1214 /DNA_ORIENTATION=-
MATSSIRRLLLLVGLSTLLFNLSQYQRHVFPLSSSGEISPSTRRTSFHRLRGGRQEPLGQWFFQDKDGVPRLVSHWNDNSTGLPEGIPFIPWGLVSEAVKNSSGVKAIPFLDEIERIATSLKNMSANERRGHYKASAPPPSFKDFFDLDRGQHRVRPDKYAEKVGVSPIPKSETTPKRETNPKRLYQPTDFVAPRHQIPADVYEGEDKLIIRADLPGVVKENINIECTNKILNISVRRRTAAQPPPGIRRTTIHDAIPSGNYSRSFRLPMSVDSSQIQARYQSGILVLTMPKKPQAKTTKIPVL